MEPITREHIIALINEYIYTNGTQQITASQMHEILTDIANAFAMEGSAAGIDAVLAAGSNVTAGRKIINGQGGSLSLAATQTVGDTVYNYQGFDAAVPTLAASFYTGLGQSIMGNVKRSGASRNLLEMLTEPLLQEGEVLAVSAVKATGTDVEDEPGDGVYLITRSETGKSEVRVHTESIYAQVALGDNESTNEISILDGNITTQVKKDSENYAFTKHTTGNIENEVARSDRSTRTYHSQSFNFHETSVSSPSAEFKKTFGTKGESWFSGGTGIATLEDTGINLLQGKKLGLASGGSAPTAGLATLSGGSVTIDTTAVGADSVISLTVQHTGDFTGNIRVSAKTAATGFTITSTQDTDSCSVFWQIIDLD